MTKQKNVVSTFGRSARWMFLALAACATATSGCDDHDHDHGDGDDHGHEHGEFETVTTINLTFTREDGPEVVTATWQDLDLEGGNDPVLTPANIVLPSGIYRLAVTSLNELETPAEDVTQEILDEDDEHQLFFYGPVVSGPATGTMVAPLSRLSRPR